MPNDPATPNSPPASLLTEAAAPPSPEAAPDPTPTPPSDAAAPSQAKGTLIGGEVEAEGAEGAEGPPSAPEPITADDLALPEGYALPEELGPQFLELMNNPPESRAEFANAVLGLHTQILQQTAETYAQQWEATQEEWRTSVQNLPEIGGRNLESSLGEIAKVLDRYGDAEAREALAVTGAGNHPALVRLFHKMAKDLNEAPPVKGTPATSAPSDRASRMFKTS